MKITVRLIISLLIGTAIIVAGFSYIEARGVKERLQEDLSLRADLVAHSFKGAIEAIIAETDDSEKIEDYVLNFKDQERLIGISIRLANGTLVTIPSDLESNDAFKTRSKIAMSRSKTIEMFTKWDDLPVHFYTLPLEINRRTVGALSLVHDCSFIKERIVDSWKHSAFIFSMLALVLSITVLLFIRFTVTAPLERISKWTHRIKKGKARPHAELLQEDGDFSHLMFEVASMASSLKSQRVDQMKQGDVSIRNDSVWDKEKLKEYLKAQLGKNKLYVVANREPYIHKKTKKEIEWVVPPSGMVTALDPVLQSTGGVWVGHGSGDADKETADKKGCVKVPPDNPQYTLKRVWLSEREEKGFYFGFSNEGIWPLCHIAHTRPTFRLKDWEIYKKVNQKFADALLEEIGEDTPYILVQDYHFAMLPKYIKEKRPDARVGIFWHIPWPNPEVFGICPWQEEILQGMLGSDLVSFHTQYHCNNFLDTVDRVLESRIDWNNFAVTRSGRTTLVRAHPISIDPFDEVKEKSTKDPLKPIFDKYHLKGKMIGLGVDRIDYIKGLLERFLALERLFEKYPKYIGKLVFVELGAPSRGTLPGYQSHLKAVEKRIQKINEKYQTDTYQPIVFLKEHHDQKMIRKFYKVADFCLVNSLHDGMNLVAKEYVAAKEDLNGALILSRFTGASLELKGALLVNPYDIEETADAVHEALSMAPEEKRGRMSRMKTVVLDNNVFRWAAELITGLVKSF